jgi:hypothetical protein
LAYIEHPTHTGPMKCGKVEVTHSKNGAGKTTLAYKYDYTENGKRSIAHKLSQAVHPESPARLQSVWRLEGETTWSSESRNSLITFETNKRAASDCCSPFILGVDTLGRPISHGWGWDS